MVEEVVAEDEQVVMRAVEIIYEIYGFEWASRLWQAWHESLPAYEYDNDGHADLRHIESRKIREWLEERRER